MPLHPHRTERRTATEAGFAISEFVLVAGMVVVLFIAAIWGIRGIRSDTREAFCQTSLRSIKIATEEYRSANDQLPIDNETLVAGGYAKSEDIKGHTVSASPDGKTPIYKPRGRCA